MEHIEATLGLLKLLRGQHVFVDVGDHVPQFEMFFIEYDDNTTALRIEGTGYLLDGFVYNLLDADVGNGGLMFESIIGMSMFDSFEEVLRISHTGRLMEDS